MIPTNGRANRRGTPATKWPPHAQWARPAGQILQRPKRIFPHTGPCSAFSAYYGQYLFGCRCRSAYYPATPGAQVASQRQQTFRRKGRPGERHRSTGRTGFREMIASGWRTAPPQAIDFEVVLATNSACQQLLEASPRVPDPPSVAPRKLSESTRRAELFQHLAPVIESSSRASAPRTLSAPR